MQAAVANPDSVHITWVHSPTQVLSIDQRYGTRLHSLELQLVDEDIIVQRYYGYMPAEQRKFVLDHLLLPQLQQHRSHKLLTDMSDMQGGWDNAEDWLEFDFTPRLVQTGMRAVAVVLARDIRSQMSSTDFQLRVQQAIPYMLFDTEEEALSWLRMQA